MHGVRIPARTDLTSSLPHAVVLAAYTLPQQSANTLADRLSLRFSRSTREQTESFSLILIQIYRRIYRSLTHTLRMAPYLDQTYSVKRRVVSKAPRGPWSGSGKRSGRRRR